LYDAEIFTPHSMRELTAEIVREKCFEELDKEIPYNLAVRVVQYDESQPNLPRIHADVIVTKHGHKAIVVGKKAATIKKIGMSARQEIEKLVGTKVFLKLEVVVRENWAFNQQLMKDLGYAIKQD
jgi:GTP-binding protein Era